MIKKPLAIFITLILCCTISCTAFADTSSDDANKLQQVQNTKKDLQNKIQSLDKEIDDIIKKIDVNKKDINQLATEIQYNQQKLDAEEKSIKFQTNLMNKRLRALYMCNGSGYVDVILNSTNFSDFLSRVDTTSKIMKYDKQLIQSIEEQKQAETKRKEDLATKNANLQTLKVSNEKTLSKMSADIKQQNDLLSKATDQEKAIIAEQRAKAEAEARAKAEAAARAQANMQSVAAAKISPSPTPAFVPGAPAPGSYSKVITVQATAYCDKGCAANGDAIVRNSKGYSTIAVDPRVIPLNSKVYVSGYGYATASDTGSAIKGNIIDVYLPTEAEANAWGRRDGILVYILN